MSDLINLKAITDSTPLAEAYVLSLQLDEADSALAGIKGSLYSRLRYAAKEIYIEGKTKGLDGVSLSAIFKAKLSQEETAYKGGEVNEKNKRTWIQNKSNIARALALGFNFQENPEVAKGELNNWCKEKDEENTRKAEAEAMKKSAADGHKTVAGVDLSGKAEGEAQAAVDPLTALGIQFRDDEQRDNFTAVMKLMADISSMNADKLDGVLADNLNKLTQIKENVKRAMEKISKAA